MRDKLLYTQGVIRKGACPRLYPISLRAAGRIGLYDGCIPDHRLFLASDGCDVYK